MKHKKIKMLISFLLALVLLVSLPLDIQANAVALEGWILYAVITYLAAMGITFTVAGGVDAMVQAVEEKVKDYETQNNIIDFYDHFRNNNVRLVPSGGSDPDGNPFFDLFFTAGAVEAVQAFANWLTSEGVLGLGTESNSSLNVSTFSCYINGLSTVGYTSIGDFSNVSSGDIYEYSQLGTVIPFDWSNNYVINKNNFYYSNLNNNYEAYFQGQYQPTVTDYSKYKIYWQYVKGAYGTESRTLDAGEYAVKHGYGSDWYTRAIGLTFVYSSNRGVLVPVMLMDDNRVIALYTSATTLQGNPNDLVNLNYTVDIITPEELREEFPSVNQGVSIKDAISVPMNDPSLDDWAQLVRDTFEDIGTIPQPVPQVVLDPDYVPPVTPAPTPEPSPDIEDIEDLGLPALGEAIKNKFPFCLPSDLRDLVGLLVAEPVTPKWEVDLYEWFDGKLAGDTTFCIDLAEYEVLGQISRWASVISFSIFLLLITKGMIGW